MLDLCFLCTQLPARKRYIFLHSTLYRSHACKTLIMPVTFPHGLRKASCKNDINGNMQAGTGNLGSLNIV